MKLRAVIAVLALCLAAAAQPAAADQDPPRLPMPEVSPEGLNLKVAMDLLEQMHTIRHPLVVGTVFKDPSMEFALKNFQVYTTARNMFDERTAIRDTAQNIQRVKEIIEAYYTYVKKSTLDQYMNQLVAVIMANSMVLRANRLHESFEWFRKYDAEYAETLREYNVAYRAFLSMVESLRGGQGISGRASRSGAYPNNYLFNDVLLYSGLSQYVNTGGKRAASGINNLARIIDNHVMAVSDAKLKECEELFAELDRRQKAARSSYDKAVDAVSKLPGADALGNIGVDDYQILDNVDKLTAQVIAEIAVLRDPELTPLRMNKNIAPDAFKVDPSYSSTGGPVYARKLRRSVEELRAIWNGMADRLDEQHRGDPSWQRMHAD
ncbi:hypothetical protein FYJ74_03925 [Pyramidobacter sp. SM-530-WT-4B]|uniref:DUF3829 domain-containing protein n=1 Tax=Pyramidobacter porci TaxID=2605789 RepID=A0A6L5YA81_9BACT|nr:hypothetical protein [Pyramidobacter porci]MST55190.1 hypothetical protein [Pyramidobacter porci]